MNENHDNIIIDVKEPISTQKDLGSPNISKFKSIYETNSDIMNSDNMNTNDNINTEESDDLKQPTMNSSSYDSSREFSVTTLDRKLKQIRKTKRLQQKSLRSIVQNNRLKNNTETYSESNNKHNDKNSKDLLLSSSRLDNVMIKMNPSKLINEHLGEIQLRIIGHNRASMMYDKRDKIIGYPVTILSSFLSSTIMMTISSDNENNMNIIKYISLVLSLTSFMFSISREYLQYSHKFQSHELSSKLYTTLLRSIEVRLIKNHLDDDEKRDIFKDIVDQMSIIEQYETAIPDCVNTKLIDDHIVMNCI